MVHVPYRGRRARRDRHLAGRLDFLFTSYISIGEQAKAGKLRIIADRRPKRSPRARTCRPWRRRGFPGLDLECGTAWWRRPARRRRSCKRLNAEFDKAARAPGHRAHRRSRRRPTCSITSPEDFAKLIAADIARLGKVHPRRRHQGAIAATPFDEDQAMHSLTQRRQTSRRVSAADRLLALAASRSVQRAARRLSVAADHHHGAVPARRHSDVVTRLVAQSSPKTSRPTS